MALDRDRNDWAARAAARSLEVGAPEVDERAQRGDRVARRQRALDHVAGDAADVVHRLTGELGLAAREVVVDGPARGARALDHLPKAGAGVAALAQELRGAAHHPRSRALSS